MGAQVRGGAEGAPVVYTIGHSNRPVEEIIALLGRWEIGLVVDVRSTPYSQYTPQFNREPFARALQDAGIGYQFEGEALGGRPSDPTCYKSGRLPLGKANYLELVDYHEVSTREWYREGIARLLELATGRRTAIMCSEEEPQRCHRQRLIGATLLDGGVAVWHIRGTGKLEQAAKDEPEGQQLPLFGLEDPA